MKKVITNHVKKSLNINEQHDIMRKWSSVIVEGYSPNKPIKIISAKELSKLADTQRMSHKVK